jgi:hypothetical protein
MSNQAMKIAIVVAALAAVVLVVPNTNSFVILLTTRALAFAILVMSVDLLLGYTGDPYDPARLLRCRIVSAGGGGDGMLKER